MSQGSEYWIRLGCFLLGGIAGTGAALLVAPRTGRDTRGRVGRQLRRAARSARSLRDRVVSLESALAGNGGGQAVPGQDKATSIE